MKRIIQFKITDGGYACFENGEAVFNITKTDLQFDIKSFYHAFYDSNKDFNNIVIENCATDNRNARRIEECITELINKINEKMAAINSDTDN